jgi:U2-associated protein SR140
MRLVFCKLLLTRIVLFDRQKLRRIEVAVMEYRESLEERGMRNTDDIEKKVAAHRQRLESEFGLSQSNDGKRNSHLAGNY